MASKTSRVLHVEEVRGNDDYGPPTDTAYTNVRRYIVTIDHNATAVGTSDSLDTNVATAIANNKRNGKTYTLRFATLEQCAVKNASGTLTALTASVTLSTNTVQLALLSAADGATAASIAAADTMVRPFRIFAVCNEA